MDGEDTLDPSLKPEWSPRLDTCLRRVRKFLASDGSPQAYADVFTAAAYALTPGGGVSPEMLKEALEWEFNHGPTRNREAGADYIDEDTA